MNQEKITKPTSGYIMLLLAIVLIPTGVILLSQKLLILGIPLLILGVATSSGFFFINPNGSVVLTLFGAYKGTVKANGFFWANPFYTKKKVSLRARNFDSDRVKVNDKLGNPIMISVILVWKVSDTFKAAFEVDDYQHFVRVQTDAAVRKMAGSYPYDDWEDSDDYKITLRSGMSEVNDALEKELAERLEMAGIEVMEARIGYLAYAEEIASAMLKRQQATAIIAAREKIVEGAVGMVENALDQISAKNIVEFDDDKKATMISNLMVVLCSDKEVVPVVNTGTLHQ
ncbi:MAG: SPFH domain-containing protein [Flavobacteriales bacterium]|nr:SPFH domain-containing protein [Flavobacteriales bacterium]